MNRERIEKKGKRERKNGWESRKYQRILTKKKDYKENRSKCKRDSKEELDLGP